MLRGSVGEIVLYVLTAGLPPSRPAPCQDAHGRSAPGAKNLDSSSTSLFTSISCARFPCFSVPHVQHTVDIGQLHQRPPAQDVSVHRTMLNATSVSQRQSPGHTLQQQRLPSNKRRRRVAPSDRRRVVCA